MMVKSDLEKIFWNSSMCSPFSIKLIYLIERRSFAQKYKFSNKNDTVSALRNFKNIFSRPLFAIIFRPEMLKFHTYSILTGETMVGFVIYCVLMLVLKFWLHSNVEVHFWEIYTFIQILNRIFSWPKHLSLVKEIVL